jgi:hypothetical protein
VDLEGWDIDLAFRNLASRASERSPGALRGAGLAAALWLAIVPGTPAGAQPCDPAEPLSAKPCIEVVLDDPDFGSSEMQSRWVLREFESEPGQESDPWLPQWLAELLAAGFELALWAGLVVLIIATLVAIARRVDGVPGETRTPAPPASLFGLDLDPRSLPADLVGAARAAFERGAFSLALSLLYRGALVRLTERHGLEIPESATELECVALVRSRQSADRSRVFGELTNAWLAARYAHEPPTAERFDVLCRGFEPAFGEAAP